MIKPDSHSFASDREDQASLWAARLEGGQLSSAQRLELQEWLEADSRNREALEGYCEFSQDVEPLIVRCAAEGRVEWPDFALRRSPWQRFWPLWLGLTGALSAVVLIALWPASNEWSAGKWATPMAQRQTLTLPDSSVVELNAGAQLVAEPSPRERRVRLVAGEAFFQVSKDPARPFIVETPLGSVQVTGTAFNVLTDSAAGLRVVVQEGSVRVSPGGPGAAAVPPVSLRPGDEFRADSHGTGTRALSPGEVEAALGWRAGWAMFDHTPLQEALARFARFHGRVLVPEASIAGLEVGGRFALEDLEGFLSALETILPVRVTRDLNGAVRVVRRDSSL